jgi:FkbM family methyltransferase
MNSHLTNTPEHQHWQFSYDQWKFREKHYVDLVEYLNKNKIKSYIDLGANTGGVCSVLLESIESLEKCYLFEPQSTNFEFMRNKFQDDSRVTCHNFGIFYTDQDHIELFRCDNNIGGYTAIKHNDKFDPTGDVMEVRKLEDFEFSEIDFLKIDVEGSEENIILNSSYINNVKFIELELHERLLDEEVSRDFLEKNMKTHSIVNELSCFPSHVFLEKK